MEGKTNVGVQTVFPKFDYSHSTQIPEATVKAGYTVPSDGLIIIAAATKPSGDGGTIVLVNGVVVTSASYYASAYMQRGNAQVPVTVGDVVSMGSTGTAAVYFVPEV